MPDPGVHVTTHGLGAPDITIRPVTRDDSALLYRWLVMPGGPGLGARQTHAGDVGREYGPQADGQT